MITLLAGCDRYIEVETICYTFEYIQPKAGVDIIADRQTKESIVKHNEKLEELCFDKFGLGF